MSSKLIHIDLLNVKPVPAEVGVTSNTIFAFWATSSHTIFFPYKCLLEQTAHSFPLLVKISWRSIYLSRSSLITLELDHCVLLNATLNSLYSFLKRI